MGPPRHGGGAPLGHRGRFRRDHRPASFLPGPNIGNASIVYGKRWFGLAGALAAFLGLFALPFVWVLALFALYADFRRDECDLARRGDRRARPAPGFSSAPRSSSAGCSCGPRRSSSLLRASSPRALAASLSSCRSRSLARFLPLAEIGYDTLELSLYFMLLAHFGGRHALGAARCSATRWT